MALDTDAKPTAKVAYGTAAAAAVALTIALVEWLVPTDIPAAVELPAQVLIPAVVGYYAPRDKRGDHA